MDIEDVVNEGNKLCACPYFSLRNSLVDADVIVLPY